MMKLIFLLLNIFVVNEAIGQVWNHDGLNARVHQTMKFGDRQHQIFSTLNIEFNLRSKCNDAFISVITSKDKKLGVRKSYDFLNADDRKNRLNFFFNGKEFPYSTEKTIRVVYDNGAEFGTLPTFDLIKKISAASGPIEVRIGDTTLISLAESQGLPEKLELARKTCMQRTQ